MFGSRLLHILFSFYNKPVDNCAPTLRSVIRTFVISIKQEYLKGFISNLKIVDKKTDVALKLEKIFNPNIKLTLHLISSLLL